MNNLNFKLSSSFQFNFHKMFIFNLAFKTSSITCKNIFKLFTVNNNQSFTKKLYRKSKCFGLNLNVLSRPKLIHKTWRLFRLLHAVGLARCLARRYVIDDAITEAFRLCCHRRERSFSLSMMQWDEENLHKALFSCSLSTFCCDRREIKKFPAK